MTTALLETAAPLDLERVRADFPILDQEVNGHRLVYLDNAASTQKPTAVIEAVDRFYRRDNANVHRGVHELSHRATEAYEQARGKVAGLLGIADEAELVWTKGTTEGINLIARTWGDQNLRAGDEILLSVLDHHSNLVPWQLLAQRTGAKLRFLDIDGQGRLDLSNLDDLLTERTKLVSLAHISNALGTINPVSEIAARAHAVGAVMVVDGAQSAPHLPVDVPSLGCDFYAFSGHKMCGPTGIGGLWGRRALLEAMPPFLGGGDMIDWVELESSTYAPLPLKFEAGTPHIAGAVGLGAAADYLAAVGRDSILAHERHLMAYALERLAEVPDLTVLGPLDVAERSGVVSFTLGDVHPHDIATILDQEGVAVRAGHHCCQPLMRRMGLPATARASFYLYTGTDDVDRLVDALRTARTMFGLGVMSATLDGIYQELILRHYRSPAHRGDMDAPDAVVTMRNPTCGDDIVLQLRVKDGVIEEVRFKGQGCAISQASASMMSGMIAGKSFEDAEPLLARFRDMIHGDPDAARDKALGDLRALAGVSKLPRRVKCAMLPWDALEEARKQISTD